jgi:hypothetical protein
MNKVAINALTCTQPLDRGHRLRGEDWTFPKRDAVSDLARGGFSGFLLR